MALDGGSIRSSAELDLQQFERAMGTLQGHVTQIDKTLASIPDAKPKVDTTGLQQGVQQSQQQLASLQGFINTALGRPVQPTIDTRPLQEGAAQAQGITTNLSGVLGKLGEKNAVGLDISALKQAGSVADPILKGLTGGFVSIGAVTGLATTSVVAFAVGAGAAIIKLGQDYEHAFRQVAASTGETGPALAATNAALAQLSATSPKPIEQLAAAFIPLKQILQQSDEQTAATTSQVLKFAKAAGVDGVQAAGELGRLFNAFGVAAADQPRFLDGLTVAMQKTGISEQALVAGLREAGPTLRGFGLTTQEATAFVAQLSTSGVEVGEVLRGLRSALGNVAGDQAKAQLTDLFNLLGDTGVDKATRLQVAIANFGARTGPTLVDLAEKGKLNTAALTQAIDEGAGATSRAADVMKTNFDRIGALIEVGKKQWAPYGVAAVEAMDQAGKAVFDNLGKMGTAIDEFLAKPSTRALAAYLLSLSQGNPNIGPTPTAPPAEGELVPIAPTPRKPGGVTPIGGPDLERTQLEFDNQTKRQGEALRLVVDEEGNLAQETKTATEAVAEQAVTLDRLLGNLPKTAEGLTDYAAALKVVVAGHQELLPELLHRQKAQEDLDAGIKQLSDLDIKAAALALEYAAAQATGAEQTDLLAKASDLVTSHLAAQTATQEAATEAQRKAEAAVKAVNEAHEKAANEGTALYQKRLFELADTTLPGLTAAETAQLAAMKDLNDQQGITALLAQKWGLSVAQVQTILASTNSTFDATKQQLTEVGKGGGTTTKVLEDLAAAGQTADAGGLAGLNKRLDELASAAMPALTLAAQEQIKALQDAGMHYAAAALAAGQAQVNIKDFGDIATLSGNQFTDAVSKVGNAAKTLDLGKLFDAESATRYGAALTVVTSQISAADAAYLKYVEGVNGADGALTRFLELSGASGGKIDSLVSALNQGGAAAEQAKQQIAALVTYVNDNGQMRLKIDVDIEKVEHQITQAQDAHREAQSKFAETEAKATAEHTQNLAQIDRQITEVQDKHSIALRDNAQARGKADQNLSKAQAAIADQIAEANRKEGLDRDNAFEANDLALFDAQESLQKSFRDAAKSYTDGMQQLNDQAAENLQKVTETQIAAFRQVASAMSQFNAQERQRITGESITRQNADLQRLGIDPNAAPSGGTFGSKSLAQIQAEGQAGLAQVAAEQALNQQKNAAAQAVVDAERAAAKQQTEAAKRQQKLIEAYTKTTQDATAAYAKAVDHATTTLNKTLVGIDEAARKAQKAAEKAAKDAQDQHDETIRKLDQDAADEQTNFTRQLLELQERRHLAIKQFAEQEKARLHEQVLAEQRYREQVGALRRQEDELKRQSALLDDIKANQKQQPVDTAEAIAARLELGPQEITNNIENLNETQVDFLAAQNAAIFRRVKAGV